MAIGSWSDERTAISAADTTPPAHDAAGWIDVAGYTTAAFSVIIASGTPTYAYRVYYQDGEGTPNVFTDPDDPDVAGQTENNLQQITFPAGIVSKFFVAITSLPSGTLDVRAIVPQ